MPGLFLFDHIIARHPVELNGTTGTLVRLVPMPRIVRSPKDEKRAVGRGDFGYIILEICTVPQQAEAHGRASALSCVSAFTALNTSCTLVVFGSKVTTLPSLSNFFD